ncbi:MAG: ABC transporter permease [Propionibacteriaceae bacterium]|jgi:simple sugar transport system permease protein|nr:ABC transporter permease [Propionibacteriaceae bacterium]
METILKWLKANGYESVLAGVNILVLLLLGLVLGDAFYSISNMQSMATQVAEFGLLALAMSLAMLTGGIDLSIVSSAVLAGIVGAEFLTGNIFDLETTDPTLVMGAAVVAALLAGLLCGLLNGLLIAKTSIPPILATLGTSIFFTGIGTVITGGASLPVRVKAFFQLGVVTVASVPVVFIIMVIALILAAIALKRTRSGRRIYLYGENSIALRFTGVRHERLIILLYAVIGLICGIAALIMVSRTASARVGYGEAYLLQAILVVVLAGFNPFGGRGKILGLVLALMMLQTLSSAFTIMRYGPYMKVFIWGAMLLAVMFLNRLMNRNKRATKGDESNDGGKAMVAAEGSPA